MSSLVFAFINRSSRSEHKVSRCAGVCVHACTTFFLINRFPSFDLGQVFNLFKLKLQVCKITIIIVTKTIINTMIDDLMAVVSFHPIRVALHNVTLQTFPSKCEVCFPYPQIWPGHIDPWNVAGVMCDSRTWASRGSTFVFLQNSPKPLCKDAAVAYQMHRGCGDEQRCPILQPARTASHARKAIVNLLVQLTLQAKRTAGVSSGETSRETTQIIHKIMRNSRLSFC